MRGVEGVPGPLRPPLPPPQQQPPPPLSPAVGVGDDGDGAGAGGGDDVRGSPVGKTVGPQDRKRTGS